MRTDDDAIKAFHGKNDQGWTFDVYLHVGKPTGEVRFALHGAPKFTYELDLDEIAVFGAERWDLVVELLDRVLREHRPH